MGNVNTRLELQIDSLQKQIKGLEVSLTTLNHLKSLKAETDPILESELNRVITEITKLKSRIQRSEEAKSELNLAQLQSGIKSEKHNIKRNESWKSDYQRRKLPDKIKDLELQDEQSKLKITELREKLEERLKLEGVTKKEIGYNSDSSDDLDYYLCMD